MPAEAVTLSKAWKVTLNGFTSVKTSTNALTVTDGSYVADGEDLDYTTLPAGKHVINTTDGSVAADAVLTSNVTVSADVELSAATQVEITSDIDKIEYVRSGSGRTSEITDTGDNKVYVLAGETLVVTGTTTTTGTRIKLTVAAGQTAPALTLDEAADGAVAAMIQFVIGEVDVKADEV